MFVELVETILLMYNIKDKGKKRSPAIRLKIVVQTNRGNRLRNVATLKDLLNDV